MYSNFHRPGAYDVRSSPCPAMPGPVRLAARPLLALLLSCFAVLVCPRSAAVADDWLPIDPADLAMNSNPAAPGSHAMILYSETVISQEKLRTYQYTRIKIFDEPGKIFAAVEIPVPSEFHTVDDLRARTVHPDGTIVAFTGTSVRKRKVGIDGGIFVECFDLPDASPGSIVEYKYRMTLNIERLPKTYTGRHYSPEEMVRLVTAPRHYYWPAIGELFQSRTRFVLQLADPGDARDFILKNGWKPEYRADNLPEGSQTSWKNGTFTCEAVNVPAREELPYPPPRRALEAHIEIFHPEYPPETQSRFWSDFAGMAREQDESFWASRKLVRKVVEETVRPGDPAETKLRKLYARAQAVRNDDFEPFVTEAKGDRGQNGPTAEEILRRGEGTAKEINMLMAALAMEAGFDAGLVHLAPRDEQVFNPARLDRGQLRTTLVAVQLESTVIALDPGTPFCPYGLIPWPKSSSAGFWLARKGYVPFTSRTLAPRESRIERNTQLHFAPGGGLHGSINIGFFGETALEFRLLAIGKNEEERAQILRSRILEWLPAGAAVERVDAAGWDTAEDPLRAEATVSLPAVAGEDGLVSLPFFVSGAGIMNPFESPTRQQQVQFPYPFQELDQVTIAVPPGGGVDRIPDRRGASFELEGMRIIAPEGEGPDALRKRVPGKVTLATYQISAENHATFVLVRRELASQILGVTPENYPKLRDFYSQMKKSDSQTIVLRTGKAGTAKP